MNRLRTSSMNFALTCVCGITACSSRTDTQSDASSGEVGSGETSDTSGNTDASDTGGGEDTGGSDESGEGGEPSRTWQVPAEWPNFATASDGRVALTQAEGLPPLMVQRLDPATGQVAKAALIEGTDVGYVPYISGVITSDDAYVFHQIGQDEGSIAELVALSIDDEPRELWRTRTA